MKRLIPLLLCLPLLFGCAAAPAETLSTSSSETLTPPVDPTEPSGSYDPGSVLESQTGGAVRDYRITVPDVYGIAPLGEDVLIFSGSEKTTLTKLSGEHLYITAQVDTDDFFHPDDTSVLVWDKGVAYYSTTSREWITLDANLKEIGRTAIPDEIMGCPIPSADRENLYYCTAAAVREFSLKTGISRVLKEISYPSQRVQSVLMNGSIISCILTDEDGTSYTLFLSTENGQTLRTLDTELVVTGSNGSWYAVLDEGIMSGYTYGDSSGEARMLIPADYLSPGVFLEDIHSLLTLAQTTGASGCTLECYALDSGLRISCLELTQTPFLRCLAASSLTGEILILAEEDDGITHLYRWDPALFPAGDDTSYSCVRPTADAPDEEGMAQCLSFAADISSQHGVKIHIGTEALQVQPWDYEFSAEYQIPVLLQTLEELDALLSVYPAGMLKTAAENTSDGILHINLVRTLTGTPESGSLENTDALCYWSENNLYIALCPGTSLDGNLYHEMYHALETRLLSSSDACYDWEYLNPDGFRYDYSYLDYPLHQDSEYLTDENRYFIDAYSMTFPKEDRARVLEYAMREDCGAYFQTSAMQAKLKALCDAIREAFGLKWSQETFLWEQYLISN